MAAWRPSSQQALRTLSTSRTSSPADALSAYPTSISASALISSCLDEVCAESSERGPKIDSVVGKDMGDGWETKRSRQKGHNDWVIIKL